jgi:diguanylate cyclase (GGDEF)-like protein
MMTKTYRIRYMLFFFFFGMVVMLLAGSIGFVAQQYESDRITKLQADQIVDIKLNNVLEPLLQKFHNTVEVLANDPQLQEYFQDPSPYNKVRLENDYKIFVQADNLIMQLRLISKDGKELIRIERSPNNSTPRIIPENKLQDKGDRYYFNAVKSMKPDDLHAMWHSMIDLNVEHGEIEIPYRHTFRMAAPIFDSNRTFEGMLIINVSADELFRGIKTSTAFDHYVIDAEGYFIIHPDEQYAFNRYTNVPRSLTDEFSAQDAERILRGEPNGDDFYAYPMDYLLENTDNAILVLKPKQAYVQEQFWINISTFLLVALLTLGLSAVVAYYAALLPVFLQKELQNSNAKLKLQAETDALTGIANRRHIQAILTEELRRTKRYQPPLSIIYLDVDHFKQINDTYGHKKGDQVLVTLTTTIKQMLRSTDAIGRYGGEEFLIILPETALAQATAVAEKLRERVANVHIENLAPVTISLGVATYSANDTLDTLVHKADTALYEAKSKGRNCAAVSQA